MKEFGPKFQRLRETLGFQIFGTLGFPFTLTYQNCHNSFDFEASELTFYIQF